MGMLSLVFLEKMWMWIITELIFAIILTELIKRRESLSPIVLFVILEVSLSVSLFGGFLLEREILLLVFCIGKLGIVPLWFWVFRLFSGLDYRSLFRIIAVYKIIPLVITFLFVGRRIIAGLVCLNRVVILYLFFGVISISNLLAVLVVFSTGWLLVANARRGFRLVLFFVFYILILSSLLFSNEKNPKLIILLFYSGLPPLGSFFSKLFLLVARSRRWGILFIPLFSGLMIVASWLFIGITSRKGRRLLITFFFMLGVFVCLRSFVEALAF